MQACRPARSYPPSQMRESISHQNPHFTGFCGKKRCRTTEAGARAPANTGNPHLIVPQPPLGYHLFIRTDKRHLLLPVPDRGYFQPRHRWLGSLGGGIRRACQRTDPPGMPWPETTDDSTACPAFRQWISNEGGDDAGNVIRFGHHAVQQQAACE